jgi:uncharacterized protein (TIGR02453 family)
VTSPFTPKTLSFLRALKRNNDREWFRAHKDEYDRDARGPMIRLIEMLAQDFPAIAPGLVADPKISLFRPYRDTRFSADKTPIKTHVAARFPARSFARGDGAGLYVHIGLDGVWAGGGLYMPSPADLAAIRTRIASSYPRFQKVVTAAPFRKAVGEVTGERLTRVPRGYAAVHPAAHYLQFKQFIGGAEWEASFATSRTFYRELCAVFTAVAPLVSFLNTALRAANTATQPITVETPRRGLPQAAAHPRAPEPMW